DEERRSCEGARFARVAEIVHAAAANGGMLGIGPDFRPMVPAALAFRGAGRLHADPDTALLGDLAHLDGADGRSRGVADALHLRLRGDEQEAELLAERLQLF